MRCVTQHDGRPIVETETLKMSNLASQVTNIVRWDSSFFTLVKSAMNFSTAFEKERGVFFLAARMGDIVEDMARSNFLTGNSSQAYRRYIRVSKFLFRCLNIPNSVEVTIW